MKFFASVSILFTVMSFVKKGENSAEKVSELSLEKGEEVAKASHESLVSDAKWVCESPKAGVSSIASGWPSFNDIKAPPLTYSLSAEEKATMAVLQLQHKALEACQKFLVGDAGSDSDEDDKDDEDEDELVDDYDSKECEEYKFFEKVFAEDGDLRRYYESNYKEGDFHCLVCGGIGKKVWKRFKNCKTLIHHSTAILRTKRKRAHRAYAQVICKVVGWDIDQLPAIVLKDLDSSFIGSRKLLGFEKESVSLDGKVLEPSSENGGEIVKESHESLVSGAEWESESPKAGFSSTTSGWPSFDDIKSSSLNYSLSVEEKATVAVLQLQHRALEACQKFLVGDVGSDSDEDDEEAEDDELLDNDSKESEEYKFFEKVFAEDGDLRRYYENNHKEEDFYCLVCGGIGKKVEPKNPAMGCTDDTNSNDVLPKFARRGLNFFETREESNEQNSGSNNTLSESERVTKAETKILALKKAIAKLEDEREAGLLQYQQSLEKMSNLELEAESEASLLQYQECLEQISNLEKNISSLQKEAGELNERATKVETETESLKQELARVEAEKEATLVQYNQCLETISKLEERIKEVEENARRLRSMPI
ncbi:Protein NETWORKED 1D [Glycine soja]|uniref:Protein NETWORKED 1D n=1 Tax=Glycine soja TaxID=3848 RepID=A0A445JJN1_GLYSO|nr:Protein NETWORKED 1D [Glycine soja]